eukprot:957601-Pyramimonas_sp.AAC.1
MVAAHAAANLHDQPRLARRVLVADVRARRRVGHVQRAQRRVLAVARERGVRGLLRRGLRAGLARRDVLALAFARGLALALLLALGRALALRDRLPLADRRLKDEEE